MKIAIAGAGPGGICAGIKLKAAGFDDFVIFERSGAVGGTWANNRYPGLCCDTPSLLYSFTFEQKLDWTRTCARQPEIREYMQHCVDKYGLGPHIRLGAEIVEARWDDAESRWALTIADGSIVDADVFIGAVGMFNELSRPEIAGIDDFGGRVVHTGEWPEEGIDVRGKRVAVVGCAASATQAIPRLAEDAASLVVYLRTPNSVVPKEDDAYTEAQLAEFRANPSVGLAKRQEQLDWVEAVLTFDKPALLEELEQKAHENRAVVEDPVTRESCGRRCRSARSASCSRTTSIRPSTSSTSSSSTTRSRR